MPTPLHLLFEPKSINKDIIYKKKRGVFQSEKDYLNLIANDTGMKVNNNIIRHPFSYLVEAADNICYRVMDIEDGFNKNLFTFESLVNQLSKSEVSNELVIINREKKSDSSKITAFRILVINKLVTLCINNFIKNMDAISKGNYNFELIEDGCNLDNDLKTVCQKWIFNNRNVVSMELQGDAVIKGLLEKYIDFLIKKKGKYSSRAIPLISKSILKAAILENSKLAITKFEDLNEYYKLRVIVDYISGMTDQFALKQYRILHGENT